MLIMLAGRLMRAKGGEKRGRALLLLFLGEERMGERREYDSRGSEKDRERRKERRDQLDQLGEEMKPSTCKWKGDSTLFTLHLT